MSWTLFWVWRRQPSRDAGSEGLARHLLAGDVLQHARAAAPAPAPASTSAPAAAAPRGESPIPLLRAVKRGFLPPCSAVHPLRASSRHLPDP